MKIDKVEVNVPPGRGLQARKASTKAIILETPSHGQVIFWDGEPVAVYDHSYLYVINYIAPAARGYLSKAWPNVPMLLQDIDNFEFTLGQILSKAGLMLVKRETGL